MRSKIASTAFAVAALLLLSSAAIAVADAIFCPPGSGLGECNGPQGVAVDTEDALVYVADNGNDRVNVFESDGTFVSEFPATDPTWIAVDNNAASPSHHDIYLSDEFEIKKYSPAGLLLDSFGEEGEGPCQFARADNPIAVGPEGKVYVADRYEEGNNFVNRVIIFDAAGVCLKEVELFKAEGERSRNFAVDSAGNCYLTVAGGGGVLRKYDCESGALLGQISDLETEGLAVDGADNLFAKQGGVTTTEPKKLIRFFTQFSPTGAILRRFGYALPATVPALAAFTSPEGALYASEGSAGIKYLTLPPPGPVVFPEACKVKDNAPGSIRAILQAEVNPEGKATTFHYEYVDEAEFLAEGFSSPQKSAQTPLGGVVDFELHEAAFKVEGLTPETKYHCRVVAENADSVVPTIGQEGTFETKEGFEFGPGWVTDVTETEATVNVEGNPLGLAARGEIEYVEDAKYQLSKFAEALKTPLDEINFGAVEEMVLQDVVLSGLKAGTTYHWRLRVRNGSPPEGIVCPEQEPECPELEHTLKTYLPEAVLDDRGHELVSPGQKNSAEVAVPGSPGGFFEGNKVRIQAGASSGEAVTYTSWTSFGEAAGAPATNQYLSRRTSGGWETENISPFGFLRNPLTPPFTGFTPDLGFGSMLMSEPALAPGCPEIYGNLYLRDNESGALSCLSPEAPNSTVEFGNCFTFAGASLDGARAFFSALVPYAGAPVDAGASLYEWSATEGLQVVSILPGQSDPVLPSKDTSFGAAGGNCQTGESLMRHVVSADGSRAIWTYAPQDAAATITPGATGSGIRTLSVAHTLGGTYTLSFKAQTTAPIAFDASAATIQAALESLSTIGAGNVEVSGQNPYTVTFKGALAGNNDTLSADSTALLDQRYRVVKGSAPSVPCAPSQSEAECEIVEKPLFVRVNHSETIQLDAKVSGGGKPGKGVFWAASTDGSVVYFTDENRLIAGSDSLAGEPDLYRYEFGKPQPLTNLTLNPSGLPGDVRGVVGASDDGSHIYFIAGAVLSEEANEAGQKAQAGKDNLYLHAAGETTFIATLNPLDENVRTEQPKSLTSRVSADGRHLAFLSLEAKALVGYDNTLADGSVTGDPERCQFTGSPLCAQAFLYDADTEELRCASCNPSGARPLGPTLLPGWTNVYEGPRLLSDNGTRVFYETYDQLLPGDENLKRDVYGFELAGEGSCDSQNPNFDPVSGGCHFLVSSGKDPDESYLVDASADGRDVFFSTRAKLTGWDVNENFDVYDYRAGGGFAEPPPELPICVGEGCLPPLPPAPPTTTPATPTFSGPGNAKPGKPKPNKKHKKKTKKQKQQQKKKQQKSKRSHDKQRANR